MEFKGKLIHCYDIIGCEEPKEEINNYIEENGINFTSFRNIFFKDFKLDYILLHAINHNIHFHIATHAIATSTCEEKRDITGLPLERVIKGFYLENMETGRFYALAIPGNKTWVRDKIVYFLKIDRNKIIKTKKELPVNIEYGTVHPFVNEESFIPLGNLELILFDKNYLDKRKLEGGLDDFSFTVHPSTGYDNHRISIQINYAHAFEILQVKFRQDRVKAIELV